jgi:hypothetical protein
MNLSKSWRRREEPKHRWEDNIKRDFREEDWEEWTESILLMIATGGGFL